MNSRRSFLKNLLAGTAAFSVLPSAFTYTRNWKKTATGQLYVNPDWLNAPYDYNSLQDMNKGKWIPMMVEYNV